METKTAGQNSSTTYGNTFPRSVYLPKIFTMSVDQMNAGIMRNAFNHFKENEDGWKECLHENLRDWEPGWDSSTGWPTREQCTCGACNKVLSRERWESERIHFEAIVEDDSTRTSFIRDTGIRVDVLIAFAIDHNCWDWPTWRVVRDIIRPATRLTRCRYGDLPGMKENNYFGPATVFGSHTWSAPFGNLVAAVSQGARYNRYVWIDIFAVRQWPGNLADINFRSVIEASTAMVVSVSPVKGLHELRSADGNCVKQVLCPFIYIFLLIALFILSLGAAIIVPKLRPKQDTSSLVHLCLGVSVFSLLGFIYFCWQSCRTGGDCWHSQKYFLETDEGKEAKKNIFFFRLWCVVEVASAVENKVPVIVKGGKAEKNQEGIYEYNSKSLGAMLFNLASMVDIASSECAVEADKVREMKTIHEKFGPDCNTIINEMVSGVISGAKVAEANKCTTVDSASCGEVESLDFLYAGLEPTEKQIESATEVLQAACACGRWRVVKLLIDRWKENKQGFSNLVDSSEALSWAARFGHTKVVRMLLEIGGIDVNAGDALWNSCNTNKPQIVNMLLQEDRNQASVVGDNLPEVKNNGDEEVNLILCTNSLIDPNQKHDEFYTCCGNFFETPLSTARKLGHNEIVQRLFQHPNINKTFFYNNRMRIFWGLFFLFCCFILFGLKQLADKENKEDRICECRYYWNSPNSTLCNKNTSELDCVNNCCLDTRNDCVMYTTCVWQ